MKQLVHITCKKATLFILKNEEGKLSFMDRLRLRFHLMICHFCKQFQIQSKIIGDHASHTHEHHPLILSDAIKEKIKASLKD